MQVVAHITNSSFFHSITNTYSFIPRIPTSHHRINIWESGLKFISGYKSDSETLAAHVKPQAMLIYLHLLQTLGPIYQKPIFIPIPWGESHRVKFTFWSIWIITCFITFCLLLCIYYQDLYFYTVYVYFHAFIVFFSIINLLIFSAAAGI